MITQDQLLVGRRVYQPVSTLRGGRVIAYEIKDIVLPYVEYDYCDAYRRENRGKGESGFSIHINSMDDLYISHREALYALCDTLKTNLEAEFADYVFEIYPIDKKVSV